MSSAQKEITIKGLTFVPWIEEKAVLEQVNRLSKELSEQYRDKNPVFIAILNGAFVFCSDLIRSLDFHTCTIEFCRVSSYEGTESTGKITELIGLKADITNRHVILVEDIVDTGATLHNLLNTIRAKNPASISICSLFYKPASLKVNLEVDFIGFTIPSKFILGYGLDLDEEARNLRDVWVLKDQYAPSYAIES